MRSLRFPRAESPRLECFIYSPVSLDKGFCFIDFFFFCICCIKHYEALCSRNALGIAGIFPCPFNAQKDQGKTLNWNFFAENLWEALAAVHKKDEAPHLTQDSIFQPHWAAITSLIALALQSPLLTSACIFLERDNFRFSQFPRQNQGSVSLSSLGGVGNVASFCK